MQVQLKSAIIPDKMSSNPDNVVGININSRNEFQVKKTRGQVKHAAPLWILVRFSISATFSPRSAASILERAAKIK